MVRLLIIGQTPPPFVGQMLSIKSLVEAGFEGIETHHVRMNYSRSLGDVGRFRPGKLVHLARVIAESAFKIVRFKIDVVYYPPGAGKVPVLRDIATLLILRRFRAKWILAFHASGLSECAAGWKGLLGWSFRKAFMNPEAAVQKSSLNPPDGQFVGAARTYVVPNGCRDEFQPRHGKRPRVPVILYVGIVIEEKGVGVLLDAASRLKSSGYDFRIRVVGEFATEDYRRQMLQRLQHEGLADRIEFVGPKVGQEKWDEYSKADIFCFPSFYSSESFGNVLIEAMIFELPVVSTRWRAIPGIVEEGRTGFLTEIKDPEATAERLARLLDDETLRVEMGRRGRERYLAHFTVERCLEATRNVVLEVAAQSPKARSRSGKGTMPVPSHEHARELETT